MPTQASASKTGASTRQDMSVILVTGSYDHEIRFWEAWSGICSRTVARGNEPGQVNRLAISPDKRLLAAAIHKKVFLYEIGSNAPAEPWRTFEGHSGNVTSVSFHSEGKWLVTGSEDGTIKIWDMRSNTVYRHYDNGPPVNDVCVHPNQGELISCDQAGSIKQWDLSENLCSHDLTPAGDTPLRSISLATDGTCLVAGNNKGQVYVWKVNEESSGLPRFQAVTTFHAHNKYLTRVMLSPDTRYLATCSADKTVKIWNISLNYDFKYEKGLTGHQRWVWDCAFSADSAYLVTASSDHTARLWNMASGETVRQYKGHHKAAVCCALHDGAS